MRSYLKNLREQARLKQKEVAHIVGISPNYYCCIENGNRQKKLDMATASKLAKLFDVSLDYIQQQESLLHTQIG